MKQFVKKLLRLTPYRLVRASDVNRFQGIEETLVSLAKRGFRPRLIVDGGANQGTFTLMAHRIFPDARIHMVEPQPMCREPLEVLARQNGFVFHPVALGAIGGPDTVAMNTTPSMIDTGAHIVTAGQHFSSAVDVQLRALDDLLSPMPTAADRVLVKLDLQGYELEALRGMARLLPAVEVILCEVSFFIQAGEPSIAELVGFLGSRGFALHDIAAVSSRMRDNRAHQADFIFVRTDAPLAADTAWG